MTTSPTVADYMTPAPHTVGAEQGARLALERMRQHRVHHLPVLHGGKLVGVLSERDAYLALSLGGNEDVSVEEVMSPEPYCVKPTDGLAEVARVLASRRIGSALVTKGEDVIGVITTTDALYALVDQLRAGAGEVQNFVEHRAQQLRLARQARLRHLVATTDRAAAELVGGDATEALSSALRRRLARLLRVLSVEAGVDDSAPAVKSECTTLEQQSDALAKDPAALPHVAAEVHASLQRLRGGLSAGTPA